MHCAFDKEKLSAYYDGELAAGEKGEVERHIASCSECLRDLGELKSAALLIKELPRLRAPKSIADGVSRDIQAAGKVHSLAKVRRILLWASSAAAGLFIVVNALYLTSQRSAPSLASPAPPVARALAKADPARPTDPQPVEQNRFADETKQDKESGLAQGNASRRQDALRKDSGEAQEKRGAGAPAEEAKKVDAFKGRSEQAAPEAPKPLVGVKPEPTTPAPTAPSAPPAPTPVPAGKPAGAQPLAEGAKPAAAAVVAEKAAKEVELDRASDQKSKLASAAAPAGGSSDLPPVQFNVMTTQLAKARPRIEESLKKMNLQLPPPGAASGKAPRNREAENTIVLELTDAQLLRLRDELEKPGDSRMVTATPVEPVLPGFRAGGLYGKKDASGGKVPAPVPAPKDKDGREEDPSSLKAAEAAPAPRRKVTLHLVEATKLPPAEGDAVPPQKN